MATVLLPRQLDTPFATIFVCLVLPRGNNTILHATLSIRTRVSCTFTDLEEIVVGLLRQLRGRHDIVIHAVRGRQYSVMISDDSCNCVPPELLNAVELDDTLDILHPPESRARCLRDWRLRKCCGWRLRQVATFGRGRVEPKRPGRVKRVLPPM